jgi:Ca-activated chloride channel family protein
MSRTALLTAIAAGLALLAIIAGIPVPQSGPKTDSSTAQANPGNSLAMQGRLSHPVVSPGASEIFLAVDLSGFQLPGAERSPVNLALVIDRSGSMSGYKLEQAKAAARHLVRQLRDPDRLAIVHYGSDVRTLPSAQATASGREKMIAWIDAIRDEGGTNIGAALSAAQGQLAGAQSDFKVSRMILISDGQPTEGMVDSSQLIGLAKEIRTQGISLSAIGVGTDFNEDLMHALAEFGSGSYAYLRDASALATVFQKDLQQAGTVVARDVELSIDLPDGVELGEVFGYRATQSARTIRIPLTDFAAGQTERVVARFEIHAPGAGSTFQVASLKLRYSDLLRSAPGQSTAALSASISSDAREVLSKRDKEAMVYAARARSAFNTERAAAALERGQLREAKALLGANARILAEAEQALGTEGGVVGGIAGRVLGGTLAEGREEQKRLYDAASSPSTPEQISDQVKAAKASALKGMGHIGSTY